jgi:hypothetical protein
VKDPEKFGKALYSIKKSTISQMQQTLNTSPVDNMGVAKVESNFKNRVLWKNFGNPAFPS